MPNSTVPASATGLPPSSLYFPPGADSTPGSGGLFSSGLGNLLVEVLQEHIAPGSSPVEQFVLSLGQPHHWLPRYFHRGEEGARSLTAFIGDGSYAVETTNDLKLRPLSLMPTSFQMKLRTGSCIECDT